MNYEKFLKSKVIISESFGFEPGRLSDKLKPHQRDITDWCLRGGRRGIFASFGLGKTFMQLEIAKQCIRKENKPFLIACPLGVIGEFKRDNNKLGTGHQIEYITDTDQIDNYDSKIYVTNYERIRKGDIDPSKFSGVSFDEASILRNLKTQTTDYILQYFKKVSYRFVATATPSPNDYIELLNYADYLGIADRGHLLTRFFKRNPKKAGDLQLLETKKKEKHICPLQLDIIERLINRFSMEGEIVLDPFGGLFSVPYMALKKKRKAIAMELNTEYYKDGLFYVKSIHEKMNIPTLFDVENITKTA